MNNKDDRSSHSVLKIDYSDEKEKLELKKHSLYLNFINDLSNLSNQSLFINY